MKVLRCGIRPAIGVLALCLAGAAGAQESLDRGKSPSQLFASDCSVCHKSPRGLAKSGGLFGLDGFLREHYMASRETAAAMSSYLRAMDGGPSGSGRASKRAAKGDEARPGEAKGTEKPNATAGESRSPESKSAEPKPADIMAPEPKSPEPRPRSPAAGEAKLAQGTKSD